jgi:cell division septation protein DedD
MQNRDSFDDPESAGIFGNIVRALDMRHSFAARKPVWAGGLVVATLAVLGAVLVYTYPREAAERDLAAVPIIRADAGPIKIMPEDAGGMEIAHRDSVVFDTLRPDDGERRVENLLPEAEQPLPREEMFAGLKTELPDPAVVAGDEEGAVDVTADAVEDDEPQDYESVADYESPAADEAATAPAAAAKVAASGAPLPAVKPEPTAKDAAAAAKTEPAAGLSLSAKEAGSAGTHFVQLGSVKDESGAKAEWKKLQAAHNGVLGNLDYRVQRADLGARGTFFRIQGGPVGKSEAEQICKAITSVKPGGCLVVAK